VFEPAADAAAEVAGAGNFSAMGRWLMVYGLLTAGVISVSLLRAAVFFWATIRASTRIHNSMVARVLRAPLAFFHTNPAGRVLNRFSNDLVRRLRQIRCNIACTACH
jgi:ABC-type multidrug transport system fused ATPase/permease subunit